MGEVLYFPNKMVDRPSDSEQPDHDHGDPAPVYTIEQAAARRAETNKQITKTRSVMHRMNPQAKQTWLLDMLYWKFRGSAPNDDQDD